MKESSYGGLDSPRLGGEPLQFEQLLDYFNGRELAQLFLILSFWANGRIKAMSEVCWSWIDEHGYIFIADAFAKNELGKVILIPPGLLARLRELRVSTSDYVFAGFSDELRQFYRACPQKRHFADKIKDFTPKRLRDRMQSHIRSWRESVGLEGLTHHAIRRIGMELSDVAELLFPSS